MKTKDFREIQVSSSLLVVIFLCVLALGVFIFLLGVSVGKKQVQIAAKTQVVAQQIQDVSKETPGTKTATEPGKIEPAPDTTKTQSTTTPPAATVRGQGAPTQKESPKPESKTEPKPPLKTEAKPPASKSAATQSGLFYVQVSSSSDKTQAVAAADKFKKQGYTAVVSDPRPTDKTPRYRVWLGGFPARDKAVELLDKLNKASKKKTDFFVVKD